MINQSFVASHQLVSRFVLKMRHGTCSDYNQYCPIARLAKPQPRRIVPLVGSAAAGQNNNNSARGQQTFYKYYDEPQFQSQSSTCVPVCEQNQQLLRREQQHQQLVSTTTCPRSQQSVHAEYISYSQTATTICDTTTRGGGGVYRPDLLSEAAETDEGRCHAEDTFTQLLQFNSNQRQKPAAAIRLKHLNINNNNININSVRSSCNCCSNSVASSVGRESALDTYQEHLYLYFSHRHNKQAGGVSVSARSTNNNNINCNPPFSPNQSSLASGVAGADNNWGGSLNVHIHSCLFYCSFGCGVLWII